MDQLNNKQEKITNKKTNFGNPELKKYCIYLKPLKIDCLTKCISEYLDNRNIVHRRPSLDYHMTLLTFFTDVDDEKEIFKTMDNYKYNRTIEVKFASIFGNSYDALVLHTPSKEITNTHRGIVNDMMPFITLDYGIRATNDKSMFRGMYPFVLDNFNAHVTVAKKDKGKFDENILEGIEKVIDEHNREYATELYISRRDEGKWEPVITEFRPTY